MHFHTYSHLHLTIPRHNTSFLINTFHSVEQHLCILMDGIPKKKNLSDYIPVFVGENKEMISEDHENDIPVISKILIR